MNLSILIPTHCRPDLFQRCLASVTGNVEIIVNNDSHDITEVDNLNVSYYYNTFDNLSDVYKFLLSKATKDYVYFLEDDDYLRNNFFDTVESLLNEYDIIAGNYWPTYINSFYQSHVNGIYDSQAEFVQSINYKRLQLSKFVFKRASIIDYPFKHDSNVHNDIDLFLHAVSNSSKFICVPQVFYCQTTDGRDNISFEMFNDSMESNLDFLSKYPWEIKYE